MLRNGSYSAWFRTSLREGTGIVDAFGVPNYRFNRPANDITNDTGSGGDFAKTGTVTDYTPGP
jgi:hypothetical protein